MQAPPSAARNESTDLWFAVGLVWELGYVIAIPAFLFGFGGSYLDRMYGTSPLLTLIGLLLAFLLSAAAVYRKVKRIIR